ncbi:MAG: TetR family transcriptional regulator [Nocardioides sp.]
MSESAGRVGVRTASGAATKDAIGRAAQELFRAKGFGPVSVRAIAAEAGADPALVIRYFGSKERLFLESVAIQGRFDHVTSGDLADLGVRLVRSLLTEAPEITFPIWRAMIRASDSDLVRERLIEAMDEMFIQPISPRLTGRDPELRARLIAAQVSGLLDAVAILADDTLAAADTDRLIELYGASIQALIDAG